MLLIAGSVASSFPVDERLPASRRISRAGPGGGRHTPAPPFRERSSRIAQSASLCRKIVPTDVPKVYHMSEQVFSTNAREVVNLFVFSNHLHFVVYRFVNPTCYNRPTASA